MLNSPDYYAFYFIFIIFAVKLIKTIDIMHKFIYDYEKPEIEIIEISVEKGFQGSVDEPGGETEDGGWG